MVCQALGRCRICARKHNLPVFGSEENQHALIEKIQLRLIVLNTVCIDCIDKFEQFVKKNDLAKTFESSTLQDQQSDYYQSCNDTVPTADSSEARPTIQFYVETASKFTGKTFQTRANERLTPRKDDEAVEEKKTTHRKITDGSIIKKSLSIRANPPKSVTKIRINRKVQCQLCCDFCEKEFTHSGDLKRHKRKHTGEKPYECPQCHKTFSQLSNLTRHRLVHSGERSFVCAECGQSYSRKGRLAYHIGHQLCKRNSRVTARLLRTMKE